LAKPSGTAAAQPIGQLDPLVWRGSQLVFSQLRPYFLSADRIWFHATHTSIPRVRPASRAATVAIHFKLGTSELRCGSVAWNQNQVPDSDARGHGRLRQHREPNLVAESPRSAEEREEQKGQARARQAVQGGAGHLTTTAPATLRQQHRPRSTSSSTSIRTPPRRKSACSSAASTPKRAWLSWCSLLKEKMRRECRRPLLIGDMLQAT
jgi:hypothetical protein